MAQLERSPRQEKSLRGGESTYPNSPLSEDDSGTPQKKSVLSIVREKAKKLRNSLSKKKYDDGNITPTWGAPLEDDDDEEDAEYLGAPMYESELAPEAYRENARQHPRATPVIADNHVLHSPLKSGGAMDRQRTAHHHHLAAATSPLGSNKNGAEKPTPTCTKGSSDPGLGISPKMQGLTFSKPLDSQTAPSSPRKSPLSVTTTASPAKTFSKLSKTPRFFSAPSTPRKSSPTASSALSMKNAGGDQTWDRGVSARECFKSKLEAGEDEKAVSQVISEAMTPGDVGVMEKVREAVTSLLRNEEPSQYSVTSHTVLISSSSQHPVLSATNAHKVGEEENPGRILQTN
ncbi:hypothetical protein K1719_038697 [Acacia pycnantha]|nr:hypothetical protein K1719_038697 [Acacia pycnantha]